MRKWAISMAMVAALLAACAGAPGSDADRNLTVGTVQKEIRVGMTGAEVAEVLGSPNIVSTDENRNEVWIYDKISSQTVQTDTRGSSRYSDFCRRSVRSLARPGSKKSGCA